MRIVLHALRPHQWVKNLLVFVPVLGAHTVTRVDLLMSAALTFVAFTFCASSIYIINDILDRDADRRHIKKRHRPFATGELTVTWGLSTSAILLIVSLVVSHVGSSTSVTTVILLYAAIAISYSAFFKRKAVVDVFILTSLYVVRVVGGGIATNTPLSSWLLAFMLFFFLSLAFVKRYAELTVGNDWMPGRGYGPDDALWMQAIGTAAGYMAILVLALYVNAGDVAILYRNPRALWFLCPLLLFWITRLWFRAGRRLIHDDPVLETLRDPGSYVVLTLSLFVIVMAL